MDDLIVRLDTCLRKHAPKFYEDLQPGLTDSGIRRLEETLELTLPEEFKQLYSWRNGQKGEHSCPFWVGNWQNDDAIISNWKMLNGGTQDGWFNDLPPPFNILDNWWNPRWIPILDFQTGDFTCVDTIGSFGGNAGQLLDYVHDADYRLIKYPSIQRWLEITISVLEEPSCYEEGEMHHDLAHDFAFKLNYGYPKFFPPGEDAPDQNAAHYPYEELWTNRVE